MTRIISAGDLACDIVEQMNHEYMAMCDKFKEGDVVLYQYTHHLNSKSTTQIVKRGTFIRCIKSNKMVGFRKCVVQLEGNKNPSRVFMSDIVKF